MTECFFGHWGNGTMNSRLRGNDGVGLRGNDGVGLRGSDGVGLRGSDGVFFPGSSARRRESICLNHGTPSCDARSPASLHIFAIAGFTCDLRLEPDKLSPQSAHARFNHQGSMQECLRMPVSWILSCVLRQININACN